MALVQGCINPIIKRVLLNAIDEGCSTGQNEMICKDFRDQLSNLPACAEERPISPIIVEKKRLMRPYAMSAYQKHMSVCRGEKKMGFEECRKLWDKDDPKHPNSMHRQYKGSGYTKSRL